MAQTQRAQGPSDPEATGGMPDAPEMWGNGGLVGDGRYRLTRRLGRGGMAEVFAAEDVRLGRTVAVKLLRTDLAEDPVSKARFTREAQSVAGLNHHAVVAVYDSGEDFTHGNTVPYIVMELVEGSTIRDLLLNAEAPGPEQALVIVSGVLEALAYSHQNGIVHRDIKPANVIITNNGAVKVMDFGIARALHGAQQTMTQTGMVMGTPQYLSPEQALGRAVDHRSDLYATGCLLYELLTLRPPFVGETPLAVVYQHVQDQPVLPSRMDPQVPPELDGLVMRSLAKEPDDRFQTAEEMRGLVQYGLQMLYEHGGHTGGVWDTGPVDVHERGMTPPMGGPSARPHPDGGTRQQPLMPRPDRDDGGYDPYQGGHRSDRGRSRAWIWAVLAVVVIAVGVAVALHLGDDDKKTPPAGRPTSSSTSGTQQQSNDPGDASTDQNTLPGADGGGDTEDSPSPSVSDTQSPSSTHSAGNPQPSGKPTTSKNPPPSTTGGGDQSSSGGTDTGGSTSTSGTSAGGTDAGGTTAGDTTTGGSDAGTGADPAGG